MDFNQERFAAVFQALQASNPIAPTPLPVLHWFEILPSTNQTLWELVDRGASPNTVVIAAQQRAGRGQWGRHWESPPGGLYLSLFLEPNLAVENGAQLTLATAWGIATALRHPGGDGTGGIPVRLKWLNDLVLNGRKLGGILAETRVHQGTIVRAVIGVGINWSNPTPETGINLQSFLKKYPVPPIDSLERLAAIVVSGLLRGFDRLHQQGIAALLPDYEALLVNIGQWVQVESSPGEIRGVTVRGDLRVQPHSPTQPSEICLPPGTIRLGYCAQPSPEE